MGFFAAFFQFDIFALAIVALALDRWDHLSQGSTIIPSSSIGPFSTLSNSDFQSKLDGQVRNNMNAACYLIVIFWAMNIIVSFFLTLWSVTRLFGHEFNSFPIIKLANLQWIFALIYTLLWALVAHLTYVQIMDAFQVTFATATLSASWYMSLVVTIVSFVLASFYRAPNATEKVLYQVFGEAKK